VSGWRFVLNRRWAGYLGITILFALACVALSQWQWARLDEVQAENAKVEANWDAQPVALDAVLPDRTGWDDGDKWTPVTMTGTYDIEHQVLVRNRPLNGQPGFDVLTPLRLDDGSLFVVDRGWVPTGSDRDYPDVVPVAPSGEVTVVARLKGGEPTLPNRSAPAGQVATVHLPTIAELTDAPTYVNAYGLLASETPAPEHRPIAAPKPPEDEGPHLSYALQWIAFGLMAFIGLGWAVRTEYRIANAEDPTEQRRAAERARKRAARKPTDADIEDQLLDSPQR
jgi:cytochrome oxidase assembly protein ShyY1